jgi:hypothetical protein
MFTEYFVTIKVYSYTHTIWSSIIVNSLIPTKRKRKKIRPKSNHGRYAEWLSGVPPYHHPFKPAAAAPISLAWPSR